MRRFVLASLVLFLVMPLFAAVTAQASTAPALRSTASFDRLPIWFEPNVGQASPDVKFLGFSAGYKLVISSRDAAVLLPGTACGKGAHRAATLRLTLAGASYAGPIRGQDRLPGLTNDYRGVDPSKWHTGIPQYGAVRIENAYDGVDLVFHGEPGLLEYDFVVRPGADPRTIRMRFDGAGRIAIDRDGDLLLDIDGQQLRQRAPVVYQDIGGKRVGVRGAYKRTAPDEIAFALGRYDRSKPLVIDPVLVHSTYVGNCGYTVGNAVAVDTAGNTYLAGETLSNPLLATDGDFWEVQHPFVWKLSADGLTQMFVTRLGPSPGTDGYGVARAVAVDGSYVYVAGMTMAADFPTTSTALQKSIKGNSWPQYPSEGFVAKLDGSTGAVVYSTYLGGTQDDELYGIAVTGGSAVVAGKTYSADFPTTAGAFQTAKATAANTESDAFVAALNSDGSALVYSTFLGGTADDDAKDITVDAAGRAYVCGTTSSGNFPVRNAAQPLIGGAGGNPFVSVLNAAGSALDYSTFLGGGYSEGEGIALLPSGRIFVVGTTAGTFPGADTRFHGGSDDAFVLTLEPPDWTIGYVMYLGGNGRDWGEDIAVDSSGNAYVIGETESTNFPTVHPLQTSIKGSFDVFVTKISATNGQYLVYSTYIGGTQSDSGLGIVVDATRKAHITGSVDHDPALADPGFLLANPIGPSTFTGTSAGFLARIGITRPDPPVIGTGSPGNKSATITFQPPANDGGDPITAYTATCNPGPFTASGAASPLKVTGLTNGTTYTCYVTATNFAGTSDPSATVTVKPLSSGDANGDGIISVGDIFYLINHLFTGGPAPIGPGDVNGDAQMTVADIFYFINHLFCGGPGPVASLNAPVARAQAVAGTQASLRIGRGIAPAGGKVVLPVVVSGIEAIDGFSLQVHYPAGAVRSIALRRGAALAGSGAYLEATPRTSDSLSYLVALEQPLRIESETVIAELEVEVAADVAASVPMILDRNNTAVTAGSRTISASSALSVEDGSITISHGRRRTTAVR